MLPREAYVVGSGPNGMAAAITLARAGLKVTVIEAQPTPGGGARSAELTLPGFVHDVCSAVHPLAVSSPVFATMPLEEHGLQWVHPAIPVAHPLDGGRSVAAHVSIAATAVQLGADAAEYTRIVRPLAVRWRELVHDILAPPHIPAHPLLLARFGMLAPWPAISIANRIFRTEEARALFAGMAAHSILPLDEPGSSAFGWVLALSAHAAGWPVARGGSQRITDALVSYFQSLGGAVVANEEVLSLAELPHDAAIFCDVSPRQLARIGANILPDSYCRQLESYRHGPGVFKIDWALNAPIPWSSEDCRRAGTLHLGGALNEIAASERAPWEGQSCRSPFVLLSQPSLFDSSRAPAGKHTAWAYCHVPNGSTEDMTQAIEDQVERFAPGFRQIILARHTINTAQMQAHNANLVGGDIGGGAADLKQLFLRPTRTLYRTPNGRIYICSASTPPGGGVHGMCGYHAARALLQRATATPVRASN